MDDDVQQGLPSWDQVKLLVSLSPLIGFGQRFVAEGDAYRRTLIVSDALEWLASQTTMALDDAIAKRVAAVLKTPEGEALIRDLVSLGESFVAAQSPEVKP